MGAVPSLQRKRPRREGRWASPPMDTGVTAIIPGVLAWRTIFTNNMNDGRGGITVRFLNCQKWQREYFLGEFSGIELKNKSVLEIGFGNGEFLAFARERDALVYGTEIRDAARVLAKQNNVILLSPNLADNVSIYAGSFDLIVALDVMEHLTLEENSALLSAVAQLMRPGGVCSALSKWAKSPWTH